MYGLREDLLVGARSVFGIAKKHLIPPLALTVVTLTLVATAIQVQRPQTIRSEANTIPCQSYNEGACQANNQYCRWIPEEKGVCSFFGHDKCTTTEGCMPHYKYCSDFGYNNCPTRCTKIAPTNLTVGGCQGPARFFDACTGNWLIEQGRCVNRQTAQNPTATPTPGPNQPSLSPPPQQVTPPPTSGGNCPSGRRFKLSGYAQLSNGTNIRNKLVAKVLYSDGSTSDLWANGSDGKFEINRCWDNVPKGSFRVRSVSDKNLGLTGTLRPRPQGSLPGGGCAADQSGVQYSNCSVNAFNFTNNSNAGGGFIFREIRSTTPTPTTSTTVPRAEIRTPANNATLSKQLMTSSPYYVNVRITGDTKQLYDVSIHRYVESSAPSYNLESEMAKKSCSETSGKWRLLGSTKGVRPLSKDSAATVRIEWNRDDIANLTVGRKYMIVVNVVAQNWRNLGLDNSVCTGSPAVNSSGVACYSKNWCNLDSSQNAGGMFKVVRIER